MGKIISTSFSIWDQCVNRHQWFTILSEASPALDIVRITGLSQPGLYFMYELLVNYGVNIDIYCKDQNRRIPFYLRLIELYE